MRGFDELLEIINFRKELAEAKEVGFRQDATESSSLFEQYDKAHFINTQQFAQKGTIPLAVVEKELEEAEYNLFLSAQPVQLAKFIRQNISTSSQKIHKDEYDRILSNCLYSLKQQLDQIKSYFILERMLFPNKEPYCNKRVDKCDKLIDFIDEYLKEKKLEVSDQGLINVEATLQGIYEKANEKGED